MTITTNFGKVVVDTNLVPYIRENQVNFLAQNLKPYKIGKIFFDDVAVNQFCQNPGKLILDSKKAITVEKNNSSVIYTNDKAFQGSSNTVNTFNAIVESFTTSSNTVVLRKLSGNFDDQAQLFFENSTSGIVFSNCNVAVVTNINTSDEFYVGEGIVAPDKGNAYATVVATSGENVLYVNQNYLNINVSGNSGTQVSAMTGDYKPGEIVYQTSDGSPRYDLATFKGIVRYYNHVSELSNKGTIAIEPISGVLVANSTDSQLNANSRIWNASNTVSFPLCANQFNKGYFSASTNVRSVINSSITINTSSWVHRSGIFANTRVPNACTVIFNTSSGLDNANGNLVYFVSGTGVGTIRRVVSITGDVVVLDSPLPFSVSTNTYYSVGNFIVDEYGTLPGIFHIPSYSTFKFKTGNRVLTVTDTDTYNKPDYEMRASATYAASGILKSTQRLQTTPVLTPLPEVDSDSPVVPIPPSDRTFNTPANKSPITGSTGSTTPRIPLGDGLSQTFFTPKPRDNNSDYGIFVTSVDLYFKSKPSPGGFTATTLTQRKSTMQLPVTVKIAEVLNGYPTKNYLASKTIQAKDVKVSDLPKVSDVSTRTKFTFDDPVYLEPAREYALIVGSDSPDYELFIAEIGEDVLGETPTRRISEQPYAGSLFRSQNSSTWTPYQNQDLMFVINKASFVSSGTATFNLTAPPSANIDVDRIMLVSSDLKFPVGSVDYRLRGTFASTNQLETTGLYIVPYGAVEYGSIMDRSAKPESASFLNRRKIVRGNANSFIMTVEMASTNGDVSPVVNLERLSLSAVTFGINNAGLQNTQISITNSGIGYNATVTATNWVQATNTSVIVGDINGAAPTQSMLNYAQLFRQTHLANNFNVGFYGVTITNNPNDNGAGASGFAVANTDGSNSVNYLVLTTTGSGYIETPTIAFASGNGSPTTAARGLIAGETGKSGGNMIAKYITREIVLEDGFESGDIKVFMDAIRPTATDIQVYYKVISGDDPQRLSDKSWRRMAIVKDVYSKNSRTLVGLEYRPSLDQNLISYTENGTNYPIGGTFKSFAVKICMRTTDASIIPKIRNVRIIAVPSG